MGSVRFRPGVESAVYLWLFIIEFSSLSFLAGLRRLFDFSEELPRFPYSLKLSAKRSPCNVLTYTHFFGRADLYLAAEQPTPSSSDSTDFYDWFMPVGFFPEISSRTSRTHTLTRSGLTLYYLDTYFQGSEVPPFPTSAPHPRTFRHIYCRSLGKRIIVGSQIKGSGRSVRYGFLTYLTYYRCWQGGQKWESRKSYIV